MANEDFDKRLDQIKEGAGLEDSRINQEFVDFVRKWSTPVLLIAALIALGYFLNNKRKEHRAAHIDQAFQELNASTEAGSPSPDALRRIAQDYKDVPGVHALADIAAADQYLRAVQRGVKPGSPIDPNTFEYENPDDALTDADREHFLSEAESLYKSVFNATEKSPGMALHTLDALYGLAAVSESRGDADAAKNMLQRAEDLAQRHGFLEQQTVAKSRLAALPELMSEHVKLYSKDQLAEIPALKPPEPETPAAPETGPAGPQQPEGGSPAGDDQAGKPAGEQGGEAGGQAGDEAGEKDGTGDKTGGQSGGQSGGGSGGAPAKDGR